VTSSVVQLDFADVPSPASAFKRVVRGLEFDVAELAIVTFLLARAHGKPLVLLPAVVLGRFQHPLLVHDRERGNLTPVDLAGRRVGLRSRPSLEVAIDCVYRQRLIPRRFTVDELFDDVTRGLG
jgi:4,5-dihydroxyphthalate decarboxylase